MAPEPPWQPPMQAERLLAPLEAITTAVERAAHVTACGGAATEVQNAEQELARLARAYLLYPSVHVP